MQPYSERYDFTFQYRPSLCEKDVNESEPSNTNTIYAKVKANGKLRKTFALMEKARLRTLLSGSLYGEGFTLFVTEDQNIPDEFLQNADLYTASTLIQSYLLIGQADVAYLRQNGSALYQTKYTKNPMLVTKNNDNSLIVNKVGKILYTIPASNGIIHIMDNIAQVEYV